MLTSYIVPSFNHAKYIVDCLDSIKADIDGDSEIIILDDGSTDGSHKIIENWIFTNSKLNIQFIHQKNQGICAVLNKLISMSRGDFIRPVASDDLLVPGSTKLIIKALLREPTKLVAFGDVSTMDEYGKIISDSHIEFLKKNKNLYKVDLKKAIITQWGVAGPALVYRKGFAASVGPYNESIVIEDWNMYLRLAGMNKLIFVDEVVAKYRIHFDNTSRTNDTAKRVVNLKSQLQGGSDNLQHFEGKYSRYLMSELYLIKSKIFFLEKKIFSMIFNLFFFALYKINKR